MMNVSFSAAMYLLLGLVLTTTMKVYGFGTPFLEKKMTTKLQMAAISCNCGAVQFQLGPSRTARTNHVCCCVDCQSRLQFLADKGGLPLDLSRYTQVANFEQQILFSKGQDKLLFYKLTEGTDTVNVGSTCCHTFLFARNAAFHGTAAVGGTEGFMEAFQTFMEAYQAPFEEEMEGAINFDDLVEGQTIHVVS